MSSKALLCLQVNKVFKTLLLTGRYEEHVSAEIIKLFIKILRGFESPDMTQTKDSYRCANSTSVPLVPKKIGRMVP